MDAALLLRDEMEFLKKHLEDLESRPELGNLAAEIRQRIDTLRRQLRALQDNQ
jgi:prefoldin subunit 5